jgi:Cu-Zn family superoxide dismutase
MPAMNRLLLAALLLSPAVTFSAEGALARLVDAKGQQVGTAKLTAADGGTQISVEVAGLTPGKHGFHVHAAGKCDPPDFKTAGPHYNPTGKKHGHDSAEGAHAGDLPNLDVGEDGKGATTFTAKGLKLGELLASKDGGALVIHADPDDGKTDPAGNAGARVACGVIER